MRLNDSREVDISPEQAEKEFQQRRADQAPANAAADERHLDGLVIVESPRPGSFTARALTPEERELERQGRLRMRARVMLRKAWEAHEAGRKGQERARVDGQRRKHENEIRRLDARIPT